MLLGSESGDYDRSLECVSYLASLRVDVNAVIRTRDSHGSETWHSVLDLDLA